MLVVIRGAGDLATGIALRLHRAGYQIVMTDLPAPTSIRRTVCFSEAIRLGEMTVEDISARKAETPEEALTLAQSGIVAVLADPTGACIPTPRRDGGCYSGEKEFRHRPDGRPGGDRRRPRLHRGD